MAALGIATPEKQAENPGVAFGDVEMIVQRTHELLRTVSETLLPAFRAAVDALDAPGALQLAQACVQGLGAVLAGRDRAKARTRDADPAARARSQAGHAIDSSPAAPVETWEMDAHKQLEEGAAALEREAQVFGKRMALEMSPQLFRGVVIGNGLQTPPGADTGSLDVVVRESSTTVDLVITYGHIRGLLWPVPWMATRENKKEAVSKIEAWKSRPINFQFLKHVLSAERYWDVLATEAGDSGRSLTTTENKVHEQATASGEFGDVGEWDASRVSGLLSRGATDWAITDEDAEKIYGMITSAAPATRGDLVLQLARMGKLGRLCENLPWRWVEQLHDAIDNPAAKTKLRPYFEDKGGGESLSKVYERKIMENLEEGNEVRAFLWTFLDTAHSGLTFGFKDVHDTAYDAAQEGWISDDAYLSQTAKGLGRAAAMMAVTAATGGAAGAWGEGIATGLGAGKTTAQIIGGAIGGGAAGVSGQFSGDVYDQLLLGKEGFSSGSDYALAGLSGAATGALTAGVQAAGSKYLPNSAKTMSQVYAERYPGLDNTLTRIRNAGIREGLVLKVTAQELHWLTRSGLTNSANLNEALTRVGMVYQNERINVQTQTLAKVHPQTEIEQFFGDVDPTTGQVTVKNKNPTSAGYVADAEQLGMRSLDSDQSVRETLGIDTDASFYQKYDGREGALFEVRFKVGVELDVPLPHAEAKGTPLGTMNQDTSHMAGVGKTKGGVPEGKLPRGTPIEIIDIRPVGTPRASYPATGKAYGPYGPTQPEVRNLPATLSGATGGFGAAGASHATSSSAAEDKAEPHD